MQSLLSSARSRCFSIRHTQTKLTNGAAMLPYECSLADWPCSVVSFLTGAGPRWLLFLFVWLLSELSHRSGLSGLCLRSGFRERWQARWPASSTALEIWEDSWARFSLVI